ncbi:acetyl-CoA sensor PanZ family protein [Litchfieldella xinjiangensis]|uniref:acetyl-CoA sensor PanZ family protein n=1 Tax=Litchfieldella xinjiangensis TaxID=1166948 RepID=UPI0005BA73C9|nr:acetyl-CoA sensor PanZ family protein [Halomonas xinjiangensis]
MPVTLFPVDHAGWAGDAQVAHDLARIYADAPAERLPQPVDTFIEQHLASNGRFFCARFNDRLLGAVAVSEEGQIWWLSYFCVRKTTRRRGVGSRLLALVGEAAHGQGRKLRVAAKPLSMEDQLLLARLGYRPTAEGDYYELNLQGSQGGPR